MFGRCLNGLGRQPLRPLLRFSSTSDMIFANDVNQITLLGSVASTGVTQVGSQSSPTFASFNLLTRARYRAADRYKMKLVYHKIHVFDKPLIERIKNISLGDRVFVQGCLSSFKKDSNDWMQCITAQNIILHCDAGKLPMKESAAVDEEEQDLDIITEETN